MAINNFDIHNKFDIKFPKVYRKEKLGFADIGGIGNIVYKKVLYKNYEYNLVDDDNSYWIHPTSKAPTINPEENYDLTGIRILVSLCNLAKEINKDPIPEDIPEENKKSIKNAQKKSYIDLIMDWCKENMHPYDIEDLYEKYRPLKKGEFREDKPDMYDGCFKVNDFMRELIYVYIVFDAYYALTEVIKGNPEKAYNLYYDGIYFNTLDIFEQYKYTITYDKYEEDPNWDVIRAMQESNKHQHSRLISMDEFRNAVIKDKENILQFLSSMIPDINMTLKIEDGKVKFTANVNSVFDISWYTIARLMAVNGGLNDFDPNITSEDWSEGYAQECQSCGQYFIRTNNRQKYCMRTDCQADRNRRKQKEFQLRKKLTKN